MQKPRREALSNQDVSLVMGNYLALAKRKTQQVTPYPDADDRVTNHGGTVPG